MGCDELIELYVYDLDFNLLGEISEYKEMPIERHYTKVSTLILRMATSSEALELLQHDHILTTKDNVNYGYIIENFFYTDENETEIEVHAYSLNYMLSWRSIITQQYYSGNVESVIKAFINSNCINPSDSNRIIPNLRIAPNSGIDVDVDSSAFGLTVEEHCFSICNDHDMTIDVLMNHQDKKFDVVTWQGADRSTLQSDNPHVIFSKEFDNIINQQYTNSKTDYKTTAIVAGEDWYEEGRLTVKINDDKSGYDRRELFIDSGLTSDFTDDDGYRNLLSEEDYRSVLKDEGKQTLANHQIIETFESQVDMYSQFEYGVDYGLGDKVSVRNDEIGKVLHTRVISATLTSNREGTNLSINFGSNIPDLIESIKRKV